MGTIVQEYGPIYGEVVNGTVQGRPNGSVYVPISNVISLSCTTEYATKFTAWGKDYYVVCSSTGVHNQGLYHYLAVATAQDLASNIRIELYSDSALTTKVATRNSAAGAFNVESIYIDADDFDTPQVGDTLYIVATLINNGVAVATSTAIELELV